MAARPRIRRRANWPSNLHEPRPGYYVWRNPVDGKTIALGYVPIEQAIFEVVEANAAAKDRMPAKRLVDRMNEKPDTIATLITRMPTGKVKPATLVARKHYDKVITEKLGAIRCSALSTKDVAEFLEEIESRGKAQWAVLIRSRLRQICRRGMALGLMDRNSADATDRARVVVQRERLSLEMFNAILAKAPKVQPWLANAMLLALVSGQDRMTIGAWERTAVKDGYAIVKRQKTDVSIAIPVVLRMDAINLTLADVIAQCRATNIVSRYLIHHVRANGRAKVGSPVALHSITGAFREARILAGFKSKTAPSFHEIRSLSKRLYDSQGNVDTKALLGHLSESAAAIYANSRGLEPMRVRFAGV